MRTTLPSETHGPRIDQRAQQPWYLAGRIGMLVVKREALPAWLALTPEEQQREIKRLQIEELL